MTRELAKIIIKTTTRSELAASQPEIAKHFNILYAYANGARIEEKRSDGKWHECGEVQIFEGSGQEFRVMIDVLFMPRELAKAWSSIPRKKLAVIAPLFEKHFDVISAYGNGATIEWKYPDAKEWVEYEDQLFYSNLDYRVKTYEKRQEGEWPRGGDIFYYIKKDGEVDFCAYSIINPDHKRQISFGNCFRTKDEAVEALEGCRAYLKRKGFVNVREHLFKYNGKTYVSVEDRDCSKCAFNKIDCIDLAKQSKIPPCAKKRREDGKDVIFIEMKDTTSE